MAADVKDLLVRLSLDTTAYKKNIADAKAELKTLRAEYKATDSDSDLAKAGEALLKNLRDQKEAAEAVVAEYEKGIAAVKTKLENAGEGSQASTQLEKELQTLNKGLADAQTNVNTLEQRINAFKVDQFVEKASQVTSILNDLKLGLGTVLGAAGETADSADQQNVSRQAAFVTATKSVEGASQEELDALNDGLREMTTRLPLAYDQLAALLGVGGQLGIPAENLLSFVEVMGKLQVATNLAGEEGGAQMAQFINLTEKSFDNLDRVGATLVTLGNNSATFESNIMEMAHRAASALSQVGMSSADILALSAALSSVGVEAQAGGSSLSKLGATMDKAAKVGSTNIDTLLQAADGVYDSVYELRQAYDAMNKEDKSGIWYSLGMTQKDSEALMNSALAAEQFSKAMGTTVDEFSKNWDADAANTMLDFFKSLGSMEGTGMDDNMLWVMDTLNIKEIRQSNMVRALSNNWELYANALELAREGYEKNIALEEEAERAFGTEESRRQINENKEANALEKMGETVTAMRKPFEDFFGDLKQWYADWPTWAQTAVAASAELMGGFGDVLKTAGDLSFSITNIAKAVQDLSKTGLGANVLSGAKTAGKAALGLGAAGAVALGIVELGKYIADISDRTKEVSQNLQGLKIEIDPASKDATLAAIAEVQQAAQQLKGGGENEQYENTSKVVQMGYGTAGMFGTALEYERQKNESALEKIYTDYGAKIAQQEKALVDATDDSARETAQQAIRQLTEEMEAAADAQKSEYAKVLSNVLNGAIEQLGETDALQEFSRKYSLLDQIYKGWAEYNEKGNDEFTRSGAKAALQEQLQQAGVSLFDGRGNLDFSGAASKLYGILAEDVKKAGQNGELMNVLSAALSSGAFDNADTEKLSGAILGLLQSMDVKQIGDQGAAGWREIGKYSAMGLAQGVKDANGNLIGAAEDAAIDVIAAAKTALGVHSPSTVFEAIGENIDSGLAQGIYANANEAIAAANWLAAQVEAAVRGALEIHSPSGRAREMGGYFSEGFARGIEGGIGRVDRAVDRMVDAVNRDASGRAAAAAAGAPQQMKAYIVMNDEVVGEMLAPIVDQWMGAQISARR